ncbi:hypothetical protein ACFX15_021388 [Malus domestica]
MVSLLSRQASGKKKRRKDAYLDLHLIICKEGRLLTVHISSVHVYKGTEIQIESSGVGEIKELWLSNP